MSDSDSESVELQPPQRVDDNAGLHPLFWDSLPEGADQDPVFQAMQAMSDEMSPDERAEGFKSQGNSKLKLALSDKADQAARRTLLREAVKAYDDALAINAPSGKLNAVLHSNRAHAHLLLGNWRKALEDALASHKLDRTNVKAPFRGAKAALKLGMWQQCEQLCSAGRAIDPASKEFDAMEKEARAKLNEERQLEERRRAAREAEAAPARALAGVIAARGYRLTRPQVRLEDRSRPLLEPDGSLSWPVLLMYPESMQQDAIQKFAEGDTFDEHLDMMFGPDAPPLEWDEKGEYSRSTVELYYLAHAGKELSKEQLVSAMEGKWPEGLAEDEGGPNKYGERAARMRRVDARSTLAQVLAKPDHIIPGIPLFWVVASGTPYRTRFLEGAA